MRSCRLAAGAVGGCVRWGGDNDAVAFFLPTGDPSVFRATELTEGPWSSDAQHAGPPSALLTRAIEQVPASIAGPAMVARIGFDILGAVPVGELRTRARVVRPGRSVELVEASLTAGDLTVMVARAWRVRVAEPALQVPRPDEPAIAGPEGIEPAGPEWAAGGYLTAVEWRFVEGRFEKPGPATVWARLRVPIVEGEEPSGAQRAAAIADSGNGLSGLLDMGRWWYINTELTVHMFREPVGEWLRVAALTSLDPAGTGLAQTVLSDRAGRFGAGAQALMVGPR
jgi:hypothetical protein